MTNEDRSSTNPERITTMTLIFKASDVGRIAQHSMTNTQKEIADWSTANEKNGWEPERTRPDEPHLILVHDQGVYLLSNGDHGEGQTPSSTGLVAYAEGCDPVKDPQWFDTARSLVGGDDFAEYLPWAAEIANLAAEGHDIVIDIKGDDIKLVTPPKKRDFWKWFDNIAERAPTTDVGKVMTAAGYHVAHTGGGCLVWEKTVGHLVFWICDEGNGLGDKLDEAYLVGVYDNDENENALDLDVMADLKRAIEWCETRVEAFPKTKTATEEKI